jgi:hypothetical protein
MLQKLLCTGIVLLLAAGNGLAADKVTFEDTAVAEAFLGAALLAACGGPETKKETTTAAKETTPAKATPPDKGSVAVVAAANFRRATPAGPSPEHRARPGRTPIALPRAPLPPSADSGRHPTR